MCVNAKELACVLGKEFITELMRDDHCHINSTDRSRGRREEKQKGLY